ncbi:acriflavine resistance protein B [Marinosulfonomonas sp. PRT-SC04]|nr:acriflavine resistance protein B [Marinosulfonomonas sp. PRT-SC04]
MSDAPKGLISYFVRHNTAANLLLVVLLALGIAALPKMRTQFFPDVVIENVRIAVVWQGAGAEDVDAAIVQVLEPALLAVEGVIGSSANSSEGSALIVLEFEAGWDMSRASDEVQGAVDAISTLPEGAEDPVVRRGAWRDRVTDVVITGPVAVDQLGRFADEFVSRLFAAGVTRATIRGIASPETVVEVTSMSLIKHDITMTKISKAIAEEAAADPAGEVAGANARVRTGIAKRSAAQISAIVLRSNADGSALIVGDVAVVRVMGVDRDRAYYVGNDPAISVRIDRSTRGDAIDIQTTVEQVAATMLLSMPPEVKIDLIRTRAEMIKARLNILLSNGAMGLGLVVLLLFLFLNARTAFWVAAGIPVAMLAAIAMMYAAGLTINMISLFALIITLGIVVDDAIVVGEHADFRARELGESPIEAAENAARRMASPVMAATITTVIAFFSLVMIGGRFGNLIADIPFTVVVVLIASLIECFLILPKHMSHALAHSSKEHWYDWPSRFVNRGFGWFRDVIFRRLMGLVVWARYPVVAIILLALAGQVGHFLRGDVTWRFFNAPERSSVTGNFAMVEGASRADTLEMMREMQRATEALALEYEADYGLNPIDYVVAEIGGNTGHGLSSARNKDKSLLGSIAIELIDPDLRPYSSFQFVGDLQASVRQHPLAEIVSFRGWRSGPGGDALDVEFYGADTETLKAAAEALKTYLAQYGEVSGVEDSLAYDKVELVLELTPQGQALGFSIDGLGRVLRNRLNGIEAATYPDGPRSATIRVELPDSEQTADFLERTHLRTTAGNYVPLTDIVSVSSKTGFSTVQRENGIKLVSVTGDISEDDPALAAEIMTEIREVALPEIESRFGVKSVMAGLAEQENEFLSDALVGFGLCLIGIFLTLAWIFSSWTRPLVVMAIIPFGAVGTIYGHMVWDVPLSMFSVVGMTGIIINDSIVLIITVDEYARERGLVPAIIDAAADRLRPVMLTTMTTVLGLAPLLFEKSSQAQFLKPTVITLVYGLGFGLVLVLLLVPALLAMQQDFGRQFNALRRATHVGQRGAVVKAATLAVALGIVALFGVTLGAVLVQGALPEMLRGFGPQSGGSLGVAFGLFAAGSAILVLLAYVGGVLAFGRRAG